VITAVYILRTIAKVLYGPLQDKRHIALPDATWYEKVSAVTLIVFIVAIGMYPLGISEMIRESLLPIVAKLI
jgi:NADH-quinone oxidoreductase subunit M